MESQGPEGKATTAGTAASEAGSALGGARADFVASLGRKVTDTRALLTALETQPADPAAKTELRRKLSLLGAAARLLSFDVMTKTLAEVDLIFERSDGPLGASELAALSQVLDDLPALAWSESKGSERPEADGAPAPLRRSALIFGGELLGEALTDEAYGEAPFDCERTEHVAAALGLARSLAPDVVLIDGDIPAALELVEALLDDPLTEPVPILVVGTFPAHEQAARYVALGVAKTMSKPISPESLRQAAEDAVAQREGRTMRIALGEPTLEQLGERLADEVRIALVESVDARGRACRVPLGEGSEVLGAIWGAIARVREVVTARTDGAVRFAHRGPEGSIALAPWLHPDVARSDREDGRGRGPAADVKLAGRRVVVADDDPGVTWFIADLLKTAGCTVYEALDGRTALELAHAHAPELVVSDILMPELDGFALCRALKRDVALRDVPVVLLSWKEDLLQRVRELGVSAAAYLRKESDARSIVARVREVLRPRSRIEARLKSDGEVRGRLDGLSVHSLLELVCTIRPNSRISVRDASFLYEVEIRFGAPQRATRTAGDGGFERGLPVIAAMLGASAGRFIVADSTAPIRGELEGSLVELLARPLANARGALHSVTGARIMLAERVMLDDKVLDAYLRATPEPARGIIGQIAQGASPRAVLLGGNVDPGLLEDVLSDLASRGAIAAVLDGSGADLLGPAIAHATAVMNGEHRPSRSMPPSVKKVKPATPSAPASAPSPVSSPRGPSSLADAVMQEVGNRASPTGHAHPISSTPPPLVEPSRLRARTPSNPSVGYLIVPASLHDLGAAVDAGGDKTDVDGAAYEEKLERSIPISLETLEPAPVVSKVDAGRTEPTKSKQNVEKEAEKTPLASVVLADRSAPQRQLWQYAAILAGAAVVVWMALRMSTPGAPPEPVANANPASAAPPPETAAVTFADIATGVDVPPGQGMLEVSGPATAEIKVDDIARGHGPKISVALVAGNHEVKVGADTKGRVLEVRAGRTTRFEVSQVP